LKGLPYAERLKSLSLTSLELRRLHNDLLWCYKIVFLVDITCDDFFKLCTSSVTRGHAYKLHKPCTSSLRSRFFAIVLSTVGIVYHHPLILSALILLSDLKTVLIFSVFSLYVVNLILLVVCSS